MISLYAGLAPPSPCDVAESRDMESSVDVHFSIWCDLLCCVLKDNASNHKLYRDLGGKQIAIYYIHNNLLYRCYQDAFENMSIYSCLFYIDEIFLN